jgi:cytochrome c553
MAAFRSGERPATLMNRIAKGFSDEESRAIGVWLAAQGGAK